MSNLISRFDNDHKNELDIIGMKLRNLRTAGAGVATCSVCGEELLSNADAPITKNGKVGKLNYCKLCGMETGAGKKFCCVNCEYKFSKFARAGRWRKSDK